MVFRYIYARHIGILLPSHCYHWNAVQTASAGRPAAALYPWVGAARGRACVQRYCVPALELHAGVCKSMPQEASQNSRHPRRNFHTRTTLPRGAFCGEGAFHNGSTDSYGVACRAARQLLSTTHHLPSRQRIMPRGGRLDAALPAYRAAWRTAWTAAAWRVVALFATVSTSRHRDKPTFLASN